MPRGRGLSVSGSRVNSVLDHDHRHNNLLHHLIGPNRVRLVLQIQIEQKEGADSTERGGPDETEATSLVRESGQALQLS